MGLHSTGSRLHAGQVLQAVAGCNLQRMLISSNADDLKAAAAAPMLLLQQGTNV
jgi:hypothetical protein